MDEMKTFRYDLEVLLNRHSMENGSNTPDFILANYLTACLSTFDTIVQAREKWYGREGVGPGQGTDYSRVKGV